MTTSTEHRIIDDLYAVRDGTDDLWGDGKPDGTEVIWEGGYYRAIVNHGERGSWKTWQHWLSFRWQDMTEGGRPTDPGEDKTSFITGGTQNVIGALLDSVTYWQLECIKLRREIEAAA